MDSRESLMDMHDNASLGLSEPDIPGNGIMDYSNPFSPQKELMSGTIKQEIYDASRPNEDLLSNQKFGGYEIDNSHRNIQINANEANFQSLFFNKCIHPCREDNDQIMEDQESNHSRLESFLQSIEYEKGEICR